MALALLVVVLRIAPVLHIVVARHKVVGFVLAQARVLALALFLVQCNFVALVHILLLLLFFSEVYKVQFGELYTLIIYLISNKNNKIHIIK